jgi:hypothetical protein
MTNLPPRLDEDEIGYLKNFMSKKSDGAQMIEWGSGGSTVMFAPYFETGKFVSIEHNPEWFTKVNAEINRLCEAGEISQACVNNMTYCFTPLDVDIRFYGYGVPYEENPCFASTYIQPNVPGFDVWDSDIYFADGICRGAILSTIFAKAKKRDAAVFLHDHHGPEQREAWYKWATDLYPCVDKVGNTLARLYL